VVSLLVHHGIPVK